jgi:CMP-N-acetylneuraminic acid synthetase
MSPKITVYITCHNYGKFLDEAITSVFTQTFADWELYLIDDGSNDNSFKIMTSYKNKTNNNVYLIKNETPIGLQKCANKVIKKSTGKYIIRLDADDYLDENALLVLSNYLDNHSDIALVFPNYIYVDEVGTILAVEKRRKIGVETKVLDLPAHGACTMVRKNVIKSFGGYNTEFTAQDGHELWLKIIDKYKVANVSTPLFYYRQHDSSLSKDQTRILEARRQIKRNIVANSTDKEKKILCIIPAKNTYRNIPNIVLTEIDGRPLIDYSIDEALKTEGLNEIVVTTDDSNILDYCKKYEKLISIARPKELSKDSTLLSQVVTHTVEYMEKQHKFFPDIIVLISVHSPLRKSHHIRKAIDTLLLYKTSSVISVFEDHDLHLKHGSNGLEPFNRSSLKKVRLEREALYTDNGAIRVLWRKTLNEKDMFGETIGHVVMPYQNSFQVKDSLSFEIISNIIIKGA